MIDLIEYIGSRPNLFIFLIVFCIGVVVWYGMDKKSKKLVAKK